MTAQSNWRTDMPAPPDSALDVLLARALRETTTPCPRRTAAVRARLLEAASQATAHQPIALLPPARPLGAACAALAGAIGAWLAALLVDDRCFHRASARLSYPQYDLRMVRHALTV